MEAVVDFFYARVVNFAVAALLTLLYLTYELMRKCKGGGGGELQCSHPSQHQISRSRSRSRSKTRHHRRGRGGSYGRCPQCAECDAED